MADDKAHLEKMLKIHQRNLQILEQQQAALGVMTPPHIITQMEDAKTEIAKIEKQLGIQSGPDSAAGDGGAGGDTSKEIYVSYAWGGQSEEIVNKLDTAFQDKGVTIIRDKRDLGYKGRIREFMERIGRGKAVIVVISEKYLKSENCMFELVQIDKNKEFADRIFPIILDDANIYKAVQRLKYVKYWEEQISELDEAIKEVGAANLQGVREDIDLYTEIRATIAGLMDILKDMNTLTPDMHTESDFEVMFKAIEQKMAE